jgi:hypothetical protein
MKKQDKVDSVPFESLDVGDFFHKVFNKVTIYEKIEEKEGNCNSCTKKYNARCLYNDQEMYFNNKQKVIKIFDKKNKEENNE